MGWTEIVKKFEEYDKKVKKKTFEEFDSLRKRETNLQDCFEYFQKTEILAKEDPWHCSNCKKFV